MLADKACIGEVTATLLEGDHFYIAAHRVLYDQLVENFFADDPIDPLTIAETCGKRLERLWRVAEPEVAERVKTMALRARGATGAAADHALVIKRHADLRALLDLSTAIRIAVEDESKTPDQIAAMASSDAMKIATASVRTGGLVHFADAGRHFVREMQERMALKAQGISIGAKGGISAIDAFTRGIQPTELCMGGGESGVGKSAVWWTFGMNFAEIQMQTRQKPDRVGTAIFSLEMGEFPSSVRQAQALTAIDSGHMREGDLSQAELQKIVKEWGAKKDYPLWLDYSPGLTLSQLRASVAEGIQKHNIGLVVIDHFLLLQPDARGMTANEADDERVWFLKNQIAKDLGVAVVCLAHTRKDIERADKRPRLSDLRGSGMIAAFADYVALMYRPWKFASEKDKDTNKVAPTDAEMIHAKNRHGAEGVGNFYFDPSKMMVV